MVCLLHADWLIVSMMSHSSILTAFAIIAHCTDDFNMNRLEYGGTREKMSGSLMKRDRKRKKAKHGER